MIALEFVDPAAVHVLSQAAPVAVHLWLHITLPTGCISTAELLDMPLSIHCHGQLSSALSRRIRQTQ